MRLRGFAILLVMAALIALGVLGSVVLGALGARQRAATGELRRTQALWLARSAASTGRPLQSQIALEGETASVVARVAGGRVTAQATFSRWGTARVEAERGKSWQERWEAAR
jgi:hypothetical protein